MLERQGCKQELVFESCNTLTHWQLFMRLVYWRMIAFSNLVSTNSVLAVNVEGHIMELSGSSQLPEWNELKNYQNQK